MKKIILELSTQSAQDALNELKQYKKTVNPKLQEVCRRLAEIGMQEAQMYFGQAEYGNTDASLATEPMKNGYKIVMSGSDVYFIEFGTGDAVNNHYPEVSVPVYSGSWSETHAKEYSTNGVWWYNGEMLDSTPAYMPMLHAEMAIRRNAKRVMKEVFDA